MSKHRMIIRRVWWATAFVFVALLARPVAHLGCAAIHDARTGRLAESAEPADFGRFATMDAVHRVDVDGTMMQAEETLRVALQRAAAEGLPVSIAGARHSMGGQTMVARGVYLDMSRFSCVDYDPASTEVTVCGGTRWAEVVEALHEVGRAVTVMQSNSDFTVGGTISVNAHGWQNGMPPVGGTVTRMSIMRADGTVVAASREENTELFRHVIGGYGLFGVIVSATLSTTANTVYRSEQSRIPRDEIARTWRAAEERGGELMVGRLDMSRATFLDEALVTAYYPAPGAHPPATLTRRAGSTLGRWVFRGQIRSDYGKELRWTLEDWFGGESGGEHARSWIQHEPSDWFINHDPNAMDVLHEYFVPRGQLDAFLDDIATIVPEQRADAINMTVRAVSRDIDSALPYAREDVFAVVMFFHDEHTAEADERQRRLAEALVEASIARGGAHYLPYRLHARSDQVRRAYPMLDAFIEAKHRLDPDLRFQSHLWAKYLAQ